MQTAHREARLRPEYAPLYPSIRPGEWRPVAEILDTIKAARLLGHRTSAEFLRGRLLEDQHFEFRGQSPAPPKRPGSRSRVTDQ